MTATLEDVRKKKAKPEPAGAEKVAEELVRRAREQAVALTGLDGLLKQLTETVLETAVSQEMTGHLGHGKHAQAGNQTGNVRNGTGAKTVLTEGSGPVGIEVPRDRAGTFEPQIVRTRQRRLSGVDEMVLSRYAKGLTTGEISAHFAEIYGAQVSKETISRPPTRCSRRCRPGSRRGCGIAGSEPGPVGSGLPGPHRSQTPPLGTVCLRSSTDTTV